MLKSSIKTFDNIRHAHGMRVALMAVLQKIKRISEPVKIPQAANYFDWHSEWLQKHDLMEAASGTAVKVFGSPSVAIIGDLRLPQCKKYRVIQKMEAFRKSGIIADFCHWTDQPRAFNIMQNATHYLFYRIPACDIFNAYASEAKRLGGVIMYDLDDPIFDKEVYRLNKSLDFLKEEEKRQLLNATDQYTQAIQMCDIAIASTPGIKTLMEKITTKPVVLWRNLVDSETLNACQRATKDKPIHTKSNSNNTAGKIGQELVLGYMSGSRAHEADFREASDDIAKILNRYKSLRFKIVGHLILPECLKPFKKRIQFVPFSDYDSYIEHLSAVDINLIPLCVDGFNECKSAIRYLEASMVKVPTIVTRIGDFQNVAINGESILFVHKNQNWGEQIEKLLLDPDLRQLIANTAYTAVENKYCLKGFPDAMQTYFT